MQVKAVAVGVAIGLGLAFLAVGSSTEGPRAVQAYSTSPLTRSESMR